MSSGEMDNETHDLGALPLVLKALGFAAHKHRDQRRKDAEASPYINHPIALATLLATEAQVSDPMVICAALLHDTIEDTQATPAELEDAFGAAIAGIVREVTDDKSLPKAERKRLQIEHARAASHKAKLVKLADKICNLRDIAAQPPADWGLARKQAYFDWVREVVAGCRGTHAGLERLFDKAYARRPAGEPAVADLKIALKSPWRRHSSASARILEDGRLELERYDFSDSAEEAFGNDVAWLYHVAPAERPKLIEALSRRAGQTIADDAGLLNALAGQFEHVHAIRDWLKQESIAFEETFDAQA